MGLSKLTARIKSAIIPSLSGVGTKGGKSSHDGVLFAAAVLAIVAPLYLMRLFVGFDDYLNALILQYHHSMTMVRGQTSPDIMVVKKDEKTSHLIGRNPGRPEFASVFRFLGQPQTKEFPSKGGEIRFRFLDFRLGWCEYPLKGPFACSLSDWEYHLAANGAPRKRAQGPDAPGFFPFVFAENLLLPKGTDFWTAMDGPSATAAVVPLQAVAEGRQPDPEVMEQFGPVWTNFLIDLQRSVISWEVQIFPKSNILLQVSLNILRKPRNTYTIDPARVLVFDFVLDGEKTPEEDANLAAAIRESKAPIILGAAIREEEVSFRTDAGAQAGLARGMVASTVIELRPTFPAPLFATGPYRLGFINVIAGNKGYVSQVPVFLSLQDGTLVPSLSLITAAVSLDRARSLTGSDSYEAAMQEELVRVAGLKRAGTYRGGFRLRDIEIPTNADGIMNVNFFGTTKAPPGYPFFAQADFFECFEESFLAEAAQRMPGSAKELDPKRAHFKTGAYGKNFGNKICMIGPFELSDFDYFPTPFTVPSPWRLQGQQMMGIEIHANAVQTILSGAFIKHPDTRLVVLLLLVTTLGLGGLLDVISPVIGAFVVVGMGMGATWVAWKSFAWGQYFNLSPFLIAYPLTWGLTNLSHYVKQREKAKATKDMFGRFVAPEVVNYLTANPDEVKPGGQKVELTIFFSDLAGFTTISESLTPEGLVVMMNEYLGAMTELLFKHGGTLDKYIGDAVMAYWNFPRRQDDHAIRACLYTLEMHAKLAELQADWAKRGLPRAYARAGMNTAQVVVGCIGSQKVQMNFTCLGDGVNLASRLEGANKEYGTLYMISDATYQKAKSRIRGRFLDFLAVKGKKEPVKVHELVCELGQEPPGLIEMHEQYNQGIALHLERKWDEAIATFEDLLTRHPDDGPSKTYLKRCHEYKENPPPDNWDGSYHLTHK